MYPPTPRWPYRAVLSLPGWITGDTTHELVLCESYYSTPEAAARAVDTICMVLLGATAAVNFPASSYNASDLEDASKYIRCISGGAFAGGCSLAASAVKQAAALMLVPSITQARGRVRAGASAST